MGLIRSSVDHMTELIDNLLDLARDAWEAVYRWSVTHGGLKCSSRYLI